MVSQARGERRGRCAGVLWQGRWAGRLVLSWPGCAGPQAFSQRDSHTPGLSKAYTCSLLCTMAQTLVFLVLIMDILGLPQWGSSYSCPQAVA